MDAQDVLDRLVEPTRLWSRADVLERLSPVPRSPGVYGWYFREFPGPVDTSQCVTWKAFTLLYGGIAPKAPPANGRPASQQTLRRRIRYHYTGNAAGSTLRLTLGCLLAEQLGIQLRRVGSGRRLTFAAGEARLSAWMADNAYVSWVETDRPWLAERQLIVSVNLPLNLDQNRHHVFHQPLTQLRADARQTARMLPIVSTEQAAQHTRPLAGSYENGDMSGGGEVVAAPGAMPDAVGSTAAHPGASAASCWTAKRLGLRDWLQRTAPQLAEVYAGAVTMAFDRDFPGRVVFVWHAMREIRNRLPDAVAGAVSSSSLEYGDLADEIQRCWIEDGWPNDGAIVLSDPTEPSASGPVRQEVSGDLLLAVGRLVAGHAAVADRNLANAKRLFEAVAGSAAPAYVVRTWLRGGRQAHKLAHVQNKPVDPDDEASLESEFAAFEAALMAIANRSYENMDVLDEILGSANR